MICPGARLGPYEILSSIASGGMGEVWRARDPRLGRDVAIKHPHTELLFEPDRLARFELEARAAARLSHPNILAIYDVGRQDGVPYVVEELVDGEELRDRITRGPLGVRQSVEVAAQIARGLAAAHAAGIVHRDLKPENVLIGRDGVVKIADFGLAKLTRPDPVAEGGKGRFQTSTGVVVGTAGYMAPEQVRGEAVDHRADIFCLGVILFEMLTARRAFGGETPVEAMTAILMHDPPGMDALLLDIPPALGAILRRCLEKPPDLRFQSAQDLAFALETLASGGTSVALPPVAPRWRRTLVLAIGGAALVLALAVFAGTRLSPQPEAPVFHQITFRRGTLRAARFTHDGGSVVYAGAWEGGAVRTYAMRPERPEAREVGGPGTELLAVSRRGELLVSHHRRFVQLWSAAGTLARQPLEEGDARDIADRVTEADWAPDGETFCLVRPAGGRCRIEYPPGHLLYETSGYVSHARLSPDGKRIAFLDHASIDDDAGSAAVVDTFGAKTTLSEGWQSASGLAWSPDGREVWFTATKAGAKQALQAVTLEGKLRTILSVPGTLLLRDVAASGRVLLSIDRYRLAMFSGTRGEKEERDVSWLDWSHVRDVTPDGRTILFDETGDGGGPIGSVYLRKLDGTLPVRLGDGVGRAIAPDGKWAIANLPIAPKQLLLLPTGIGRKTDLTHDALNHVRARFFPGGERFLFAGSEPGRGIRLWVQTVGEKEPRAITPEGIGPAEAISPDGSLIAAIDPNGALVLYPTNGAGEARAARGAEPGELPISFAGDGAALFVRSATGVPAKVTRIDPATGARTPWLELAPADAAGVEGVTDVFLSADGERYACSVMRILSDLFVVDGVR